MRNVRKKEEKEGDRKVNRDVNREGTETRDCTMNSVSMYSDAIVYAAIHSEINQMKGNQPYAR